MSKEIERKFLVRDNGFLSMSVSQTRLTQAYLSVNPRATVRIRIAAEQAYITVKGENHGAVRDEWEYPIPLSDAKDIIDRCCDSANIIDKTRYVVPYNGHDWEIDVFAGRLKGLVIAEIELESIDTIIEIPSFVGREITNDTRYYNSVLSDSTVPLPPMD